MVPKIINQTNRKSPLNQTAREQSFDKETWTTNAFKRANRFKYQLKSHQRVSYQAIEFSKPTNILVNVTQTHTRKRLINTLAIVNR